MSKEEFLKIQTTVLKVNIHCDGCKHKVKKILQKIDGVYKTSIDSEQGKVTASGTVDPETLIKKLTKSGKHAEIWGAPRAKNQQQQQLANQFKGMQIDSGKGGKGPKGGGGGGPQGGQLPPQLQQQLKDLQNKKMMMPQMKDRKNPFANNSKGQDPKSVKFNMPEDDEFDDDDDYDDDDFDDDYDDDEFDDDLDEAPLSKMKGMMGKGGGGQMPNMLVNGQHPMLMKGGNGGGGNGGNAKKGGGGGNIPVQMNMGGGNSDGKNGGKTGGNASQHQGGGGDQKGGKNGGGQAQDGKNGGGGGAQNKNGNNGGGGANHNNGNGGKKGGQMNDGLHGMPNMMAMNAGANVGPLGSMPMGQMGGGPMGQMGQIPAVQGLPAGAAAGMNGGGGGGAPGGYFQGAGPEAMAGNPYYQQQMAAMMMNQQRAAGNERFQPMMYARPLPAVNYMPPYNPYPYPPPPHDPYSSYFSDENTASCNVM